MQGGSVRHAAPPRPTDSERRLDRAAAHRWFRLGAAVSTCAPARRRGRCIYPPKSPGPRMVGGIRVKRPRMRSPSQQMDVLRRPHMVASHDQLMRRSPGRFLQQPPSIPIESLDPDRTSPPGRTRKRAAAPPSSIGTIPMSPKRERHDPGRRTSGLRRQQARPADPLSAPASNHVGRQLRALGLTRSA
jgi:hypothetical protein